MKIGHRRLQPGEQRLEIASGGVVEQERPHAVTRILEDAPHDEPALGDEQAMRAGKLGIADTAIQREPRIVVAADNMQPADTDTIDHRRSTHSEAVSSNRPLRHLARDLRYAVRGLGRSPLFTAVAVLSIALGIGANTAIFTLIDEVLVRMLPVKDPDELVLFNGARNHYGSNSGGNMLSFPMYEDFRDNFVDRSTSPALPRINPTLPNPAPTPKIFSGMFARRSMAIVVGIDGQSERVPAEIVSGTYFQVLGVGAAIGRVITPDDDRERHGGAVAVLSYDYWRTRFGADPNVLGKTIIANNHKLTIVGVSQAGFDGVDIGYVPNLRVPITMKAEMTPNWDDMDNRRSRWVNVFGRLKPGVTREQALAALQPYFHGMLEQEVLDAAFSSATTYTREQFLKGTMDLLPAAQGRSPIRQQLSQPLRMLLGIVAGVLLIACANVASLLIARAAARQKEIALRLALGASRGRIVGQLLVESVLLAAIGGLLGLVIASWTVRFLLEFLPTSETPHVITGALNYRVLGFNFALALATGLLFGLVPALRSTKPSLAPTLKDQVGSVVGGGVRLRKALVIAQVTISVLLLISAGLFIRHVAQPAPARSRHQAREHDRVQHLACRERLHAGAHSAVLQVARRASPRRARRPVGRLRQHGAARGQPMGQHGDGRRLPGAARRVQ